MKIKFNKLTPITIYCILMIIISIFWFVLPVKAEEQFNQTLSFSGGGSQYDTGSQTDVNNTLLGYQGINNISSIDVNFNNVKILSELKFFGTYDNVGDVVKTPASGIMSKYTNFDAYINGVYYGSGQIGWYRQTFIVAETPIYYRIIFDNVDTTYANSLTGIKNMKFSYDNTVYDNTVIPAGVCAGSMPGYTGTFTYVRIFIENSCHNKYSNIIQNNANDQYVGFSFYSTYHLTFNNISNVAGWLNLTKFSSNAELTITNSTGTHIFDNTTTANEHLYQLKSGGLNANVKDVVANQWSNWSIFNSNGIFCYPDCYPVSLIPTGNITTSKVNYNISENIVVKYNISSKGQIIIEHFVSNNNSKDVYSIPVNSGNDQILNVSSDSFDIGDYSIRLYYNINDQLYFLYISFFHILPKSNTSNIKIDKSNYNQGNMLTYAVYTTYQNSYVLINDSNNNILANNSILNANSLYTEFNGYFINSNSPTGIYTASLFGNGGLLSYDTTFVNFGLQSTPTVISTSIPNDEGLLGATGGIGKSIIGTFDINENGDITDSGHNKNIGRNGLYTLLLIVFIIFVVGTWKKASGK